MTQTDGNKYRIARTMAGMTQERWAEAIDVDVRSVARYESGETLPITGIRAASALSPSPSRYPRDTWKKWAIFT